MTLAIGALQNLKLHDCSTRLFVRPTCTEPKLRLSANMHERDSNVFSICVISVNNTYRGLLLRANFSQFLHKPLNLISHKFIMCATDFEIHLFVPWKDESYYYTVPMLFSGYRFLPYFPHTHGDPPSCAWHDVKVGSHEGTCCRDMSRGRISCAVHTKGHVAGIGFLKCSHGGSCRRDMSWFRFLIGLFSEVSRGHVAWTVHTRRPCV